MRFLIVSGVVFLASAIVFARENVPVGAALKPFPILKDNAGNIVLGGALDVMLYPDGTSTDNIKDFTKGDKSSLEFPENVIVRLLDCEKRGDLNGILALCHDENDKSKFRHMYQDIEGIRSNAVQVERYVFRQKINWGPYVWITVKPVSSKVRVFTHHYTLVRGSESKFQLVMSANCKPFELLAVTYPYWASESERKFEPTKDLIALDLKCDASGKEKNEGSVAKVYVRPVKEIDRAIISFVGNVSKLYLSGENEKILELWEDGLRDEMKTNLEADQADAVWFGKHASKGVEIPFVVQAGDLTYVFVVGDSHEKIDGELSKMLCVKKINGKMFLTRGGEANYFTEDLMGTSFFIGGVIKALYPSPAK